MTGITICFFYGEFIKTIATATRHPIFINQCAFKLSPDKFRDKYATFEEFYDVLDNLTKNEIPFTVKMFLRQAFTTKPILPENGSACKD